VSHMWQLNHFVLSEFVFTNFLIGKNIPEGIYEIPLTTLFGLV
jgi:hypothetical protein